MSVPEQSGDVRQVIERLRRGSETAVDGFVKEVMQEVADLIEQLLATDAADVVRLKARIELMQRTIDRYTPCSDHRDKVKVGECPCCYGERSMKLQLAAESLVSQPAPSGWQPIESAPKKHKRVVMLYGEEFGRRVWMRGYYFKGVPGDGEGWITTIIYCEPNDDWRGGGPQPTHWMPFPPEPRQNAVDALPPAPEVKDAIPPQPQVKLCGMCGLMRLSEDAIPPGPEGATAASSKQLRGMLADAWWDGAMYAGERSCHAMKQACDVMLQRTEADAASPVKEERDGQ